MKLLIFGNFYQGNVAYEIELFFKKKSFEVYRFDRSSFFNLSKNRFVKKGLNFFFYNILEFILNITLIIKCVIYKPKVFFCNKRTKYLSKSFKIYNQ